MFKPIVVPLDGSPLAEIALVPARAFARRFDAEFLLMRVCAVPEVPILQVPGVAPQEGPRPVQRMVGRSPR